jgi:hypothetical protein
MSTVAVQKKLAEIPDATAWQELDESRWRAWTLKGLASDEQGRASLLKRVTWTTVALLVAAAGVGSLVGQYAVIIRFLVMAGAFFVMASMLQTRRYVLAALCGVVAVLHNPMAPMLGLETDLQRALAVVCAIPFVASAFGLGKKGV